MSDSERKDKMTTTIQLQPDEELLYEYVESPALVPEDLDRERAIEGELKRRGVLDSEARILHDTNFVGGSMKVRLDLYDVLCAAGKHRRARSLYKKSSKSIASMVAELRDTVTEAPDEWYEHVEKLEAQWRMREKTQVWKRTRCEWDKCESWAVRYWLNQTGDGPDDYLWLSPRCLEHLGEDIPLGED